MNDYEKKIYKRKLITSSDEYFGDVSNNDTGILFKALNSAMKSFQKKLKKEGYTDFYIVDRMNGNYAEDGYYTAFYATRLENDTEYNQRISEYENRKNKRNKK